MSEELGATKDTLSNMLSQLADKSKSISETERKVAEASKKLKASTFPYKRHMSSEHTSDNFEGGYGS